MNLIIQREYMIWSTVSRLLDLRMMSSLLPRQRKRIGMRRLSKNSHYYKEEKNSTLDDAMGTGTMNDDVGI
jgi:hypothetical protein